MKKHLLFLFSIVLVAGSLNYLQAQSFVGSDACAACHDNSSWDYIYSEWANSGHPFKFNVIEENQPPVYPPYVTNYQSTWMDNLGDGSHDYSQIAGVIGGYGWKARFVGNDGHVVGTAGSAYSTGLGHNQINFYGGEDHGWVNYHPEDVKIYNYGCFKCHTTGGDQAGTWLEGVEGLGTFTEQGIGCESCHGPGSDHVASPTDSNIDIVYEFAHQDNAMGGLEIDGVVTTADPEGDNVNFLCGTCHNRDYKNPINASGGFVRHHEQWDEYVTTAHYGNDMSCTKCHDPHKRTIWDGEGIKLTCGTCHSDQVETVNHGASASCLDCHMPYAAKSGTKRGQSGFVGDVRSHLFTITVDTASMFTADGAWVRDDETRPASLSPAYSCLGCHNNDPDDNIPDKTLEEAVAQAKDMHDATLIGTQRDLVVGVYPNPATGPVKISFNLDYNQDVGLQVFNSSGQMVYQASDVSSAPGNQTIVWDRTSNTGADVVPGYYLVKVTAGTLTSVQKLVLMD